MRNSKGDFLVTLEGLSIIFIGVLAFITMGAVFYGVGDSQGLFSIAENTMNVTNHTAYQTVKTTWHWVPLGILAAGFITMLVWSQRRQPYQEQYY